jgi:hypothetical protein
MDVEVVVVPSPGANVHVHVRIYSLRGERIERPCVDTRTFERSVILELYHDERQTDRRNLRRMCLHHEVVGRQRYGGRDRLNCRLLSNRQLFGRGKLAEKAVTAALDADGNEACPLLERHCHRVADVAKTSRRGQRERGPDIRVTGKRNLFCRRENAYLSRVARPRRQDEGALGEVELASDLLHLLRRQPVGERKHSELVSAEARVGEDVADVVLVSHGRHR